MAGSQFNRLADFVSLGDTIAVFLQVRYAIRMDTILHFITEPDHVIFAAAVAVMLLGKTDKRWFWAFTMSGLAWVVLSHIFMG